jgi:hypothetical protein
MPDDAAGAVRRTPRPVRVPALWWSPTDCTVYADRGGAAPHYLQMRDTKHFGLPLDAVQLVGPDQRRPVVLLRADDCDCGPPYADCPHGPEPVDALDLAVWLHAEAKHQYAELLAQRDGWWSHCNRERDALQARIDAALALHARDDDGACRACGVDAYEEPIAWPCATVAALQGDQPTEADRG